MLTGEVSVYVKSHKKEEESESKKNKKLWHKVSTVTKVISSFRIISKDSK